MSFAAILVSLYTQVHVVEAGVPAVPMRSWLERLCTAGDAFWFYLGKVLWPYPFSTIYPRWKIDANDWVSYGALAATSLLLLVVWTYRRSWARSYFMTLACFLVAVLPVLGLVDLAFFHYTFVADHFVYLGSMVPLALAGAGFDQIKNWMSGFALRTWYVSSTALLLLLAVISWQRSRIYRDDQSLWTQAAAVNPNNATVQYNLAKGFMDNGHVDEAMVRYQEALKLDPYHSRAHNNLGNAFLSKGRVDEAIVQYQETLKLSPSYAQTHSNLGNAFLRKGQVDEAIAQFRSAIKIDPNNAKFYDNLGIGLVHKGLLDEAMEEFRNALEIDPNNAKVHNNLGYVLLKKGKVSEAIAEFQAALRSRPDDIDAQNNLAQAQNILRKMAPSP